MQPLGKFFQRRQGLCVQGDLIQGFKRQLVVAVYLAFGKGIHIQNFEQLLERLHLVLVGRHCSIFRKVDALQGRAFLCLDPQQGLLIAQNITAYLLSKFLWIAVDIEIIVFNLERSP